MANGADAKAADAAVRYAADQARAAGAIDDRTRFAAEARVGATAAMAWLQPAIRRGQGAVKIAEEKSNGYLPGFKEADILSVEKGLRPPPSTYLSPKYIESHFSQFDAGASRFVRKDQFERYGIG